MKILALSAVFKLDFIRLTEYQRILHTIAILKKYYLTIEIKIGFKSSLAVEKCEKVTMKSV